MDGLEATDAIRALDTDYARQIPVIALTANAIQGTKSIFYEHDFQDFVSKPIDIMQLDRVVRKWIRNVKPVESGENESEPDETADKPDIPGLNTEKGMALCDWDRELYKTALQSYVINAPSVINKIRTVSEKTLYDYEVNTHGIKSISANIGAEIAVKTAARLERLAKSGDLENILLENEGFIKDIENLIAAVKTWLEKQE